MRAPIGCEGHAYPQEERQMQPIRNARASSAGRAIRNPFRRLLGTLVAAILVLAGAVPAIAGGAPYLIDSPAKDFPRIAEFEGFLRKHWWNDIDLELVRYSFGKSQNGEFYFFRLESPAACLDDMCPTIILRPKPEVSPHVFLFAGPVAQFVSDFWPAPGGGYGSSFTLTSKTITYTVLETPIDFIVSAGPVSK
jgi:hypothetical protein